MISLCARVPGGGLQLGYLPCVPVRRRWCLETGDGDGTDSSDAATARLISVVRLSTLPSGLGKVQERSSRVAVLVRQER